jgi:CubicO group peptidase (beta-lactamase class C family)
MFTIPILFVLLIGAIALYLDLHLYLRPVPDDLDTAIQEQLEAAKLPGAVIAVIQDNQIVFAKGYGYANLEQKRPVTPDTIFQIASVSKLVTATTLMRLYEQGKFGLDDDINAYLPFSVRNPQYPETAITFRMLLAHTSSIADGPSYESTYTLGKSADSPLALGDYLRDYFTSGGMYYDAQNNFTADPPGAVYAYSNVGFGLVGYLAERIAGQPFDQLSRQEVFAPLGMTSSSWFYGDIDPSRWAMPYQYQIISRSYVPLGAYGFATYPDGALKTSANDFVRFLSPFINNGQTIDGNPYLKPETVAEMLRVQYPESGESNGLAWVVKPTTAQHAGGDPGVSTLAALNLAKHRGLVIFTNSGGADTPGMLRSTFGFQQFVKKVAALLKNLP